jgi:CheY-specific phosphatase CheX
MCAEQMAVKLRHAASSVLEMMFMVPVVADQEFPPAELLPPILIGLEFRGEVAGTFTLAVGTSTAEHLALSFMGMDADEHLERQPVVEVLGELANMLCGNFLGQLQYRDSFQLSSPREVTLSEVSAVGHTYQRTVHLDRGTLSMQVAVRE